jgi:glycosyltransferase involved in cell wall biosynthesis
VYSREVLHGMAALYPEQRFLWCYRPHRFLRSLRQPVPAPCRRRVLWENLLPRCGLFHGMNQRLPAARARRSVVTFHDLFVMTGEYSTAEFRTRFTGQARQAAERADLIIAVSQFTAAQVEALLGVDKGRIRVAGHGVHLPDTDPGGVREKLVLHVGVIQKRKNVVRLVEAFERMPPDWRLVLAGGQGYGCGPILERIGSSTARARITLTGYVSDAALAALYRRAAIFAFPSLDEGFGIPVLEAMAYGVPVVASNRPAVAEVVDGAGLLVDPEDTGALAEGLLRVAGNAELAAGLAAKGRLKAAANSWRRAAERTCAIYRELLG